jgi:hypothetical protein
VALAAQQSWLWPNGTVSQTVFLYIAAFGVNVLNCLIMEVIGKQAMACFVSGTGGGAGLASGRLLPEDSSERKCRLSTALGGTYTTKTQQALSYTCATASVAAGPGVYFHVKALAREGNFAGVGC